MMNYVSFPEFCAEQDIPNKQRNDPFARQALALGYELKMRHRLCAAVTAADVGREEAIVMGIIALTRSSSLDHNIVLGAAISYLNAENSVHKNPSPSLEPSL